MSREFLLEVGCEEIPARAMAPALGQLQSRFETFLQRQKLGFDSVETLGSARRLVVFVRGLAERQPVERVTTLGPPERIAFQDGQPSKALIGFARKSGRALDEFRVVETERGRYMGFDSEAGGRPASEVLAESVPELIGSLTFPKTMYWTESRMEFARPIRWVVALLGGSRVPFELYGIASGDTTAGHRVLGSGPIRVSSIKDYVAKLEDEFVLVSQHRRRERIEQELQAAADSLGGGMIPDAGLLEEVIYINEYPRVIVGSFDEKFLELPREVPVTVMREHQKYFAIERPDNGGLLPNFLAVINTRDDAQGVIRKGHERVLKARLSDALFFWQVDSKRSLEDRVSDLASLTFHKKLGTYADKVARMGRLAGQINHETAAGVDPEVLGRAVRWSKSDLMTDLVGEFADLQGIVGGLYARRERQPDDVWMAIYDQYRPTRLDDRSPRTRSGAVLSLADRIDTVLGCFSAGLIPTGSADPLALRRHTQGIIKILLDHGLKCSIGTLIDFDGRLDKDRREAFWSFYKDRLRFVLGQMGFAYDEVNAVVATGADNPTEVLERVRALHDARQSADLVAVAAAFKRIKNILRQADWAPEPVSITDGMEVEEKALALRVDELEPQIANLARSGQYPEALAEMAAIRPVVDRFFDEILVMHEEPRIRGRRLSLLQKLFDAFLQVADISEVVVDTVAAEKS